MNSDCSRWIVSKGVAQQPSVVQWLPWKILLSIGKIFPPSDSFAGHSGIKKQIICAVASISMFFHGVKNFLVPSNHFKALMQTVCCSCSIIFEERTSKNINIWHKCWQCCYCWHCWQCHHTVLWHNWGNLRQYEAMTGKISITLICIKCWLSLQHGSRRW